MQNQHWHVLQENEKIYSGNVAWNICIKRKHNKKKLQKLKKTRKFEKKNYKILEEKKTYQEVSWAGQFVAFLKCENILFFMFCYIFVFFWASQRKISKQNKTSFYRMENTLVFFFIMFCLNEVYSRTIQCDYVRVFFVL